MTIENQLEAAEARFSEADRELGRLRAGGWNRTGILEAIEERDQAYAEVRKLRSDADEVHKARSLDSGQALVARMTYKADMLTGREEASLLEYAAQCDPTGTKAPRLRHLLEALNDGSMPRQDTVKRIQDLVTEDTLPIVLTYCRTPEIAVNYAKFRAEAA